MGVYTDRQIVARYFRGSLTKPIGAYSDAYVHRLARAAQGQVKAGQPINRQTARGHKIRTVAGLTTAREHPQQYVMREHIRVPIRGAKPATYRGAPAGVIVNREYDGESVGPAWRYLAGLPADVGVQIVALGVLSPEHKAKYPRLGLVPPGPEDDEDDEEPEEDDEPVWRTVYTGTPAGDPDENGAGAADVDELRAALDAVFVPGTVETIIVRWQR